MNRDKDQRSWVLYIGTHRLAGVLVEKDTERLKVLRTAEILEPEGFQRGEVSQIEKALVSVGELVKRLNLQEDAFELPVYVLLSNPQLRMTRFSSSVYYSGYPRMVTSREIRQVIEQTRSVAPLPLEEWILQAVPESFWVNDLTGVEDPTGLEAQRLAVSLQIFSSRYGAFRNVIRLLESLEFNVKGYFPKTLTLADGILTESEKEEEVLVVDFADGVTHLVLTREGRIVQTKSLEKGSRFFTARIAEKWQVSLREARRLKEQFGSLEENLQFGEELIPLVERNGHPHHQIKRSEFHQVFQGLADEFLAELEKEIRAFLEEEKSTHPHLVFTGGGVKLEGFLEFVSRRFQFSIRLGLARHIEGVGNLLTDPAWAGPLGFLRRLDGQAPAQSRVPVKENLLERALVQCKEWLVAYF